MRYKTIKKKNAEKYVNNKAGEKMREDRGRPRYFLSLWPFLSPVPIRSFWIRE